MGTELSKHWTELLARVQQPLQEDLARISERIDQVLFADFPPINTVLSHLFSRRGKLIRPTLLLLAADLRRVDPAAVAACGAAIEIVHTASLVHDDSIDRSHYRRGVETLNFKWDDRTSVIIGDYLLSRAFVELSGLGKVEVVRELAWACQNLARGEMRQMLLEGNLAVTEQEYFDFIREKTAALFGATCRMAGLLSGESRSERLREFGMLFGSLFQITDDLLDYVGLSPEIGKPTGNDLRERKMTLPLIYAMQGMDSAARAEVRRLYTAERLGDREVARLQQLVAEHGGLDRCWDRVVELAEQCRRLLETIPGGPASRLLELVEIVVERDR